MKQQFLADCCSFATSQIRPFSALSAARIDENVIEIQFFEIFKRTIIQLSAGYYIFGQITGCSNFVGSQVRISTSSIMGKF
jgi:hypothetical protein